MELKKNSEDMFCPLTCQQLFELFPASQGVESLGVKQWVHFMIELEHRVKVEKRPLDLVKQWGQYIGSCYP